jgi:DNA-binding response OmpR family regulator
MKREVKILLVEDNEGDIVLTLEALKEAKISKGIEVVRDGEEALQYLRKTGRYTNAETPDIILLDINLPKVNGKELLVKIKKDDTLKMIPTIILTTSDSEKEIIESYLFYANCYITKPTDFHKFTEVMRVIIDFWFRIVQLPNKKIYEQRN